MSEDNKLNLLFFEGPSVRELYAKMDEWQKANRTRFQSITLQKDGDLYCCIALTNPSEVTIVGYYTSRGTSAEVSGGRLHVKSG